MTDSNQTAAKLEWHQRFLLVLLGFFMRVWGRTLRFYWGPDVQALLDAGSPPAVVVFWHNRLFAAPIFFLRYFRQRRLATLISASKDGAWLAAFVQRLGMRPVRGSRYKRGAQAVRDLLLAQAEGFDLAITPDGSRGPLYDMKPGAVKVALKTGAPIVLLSFNYSGAWRLKSWDRFYIPHPFSRVEVRIDQVGPALTLCDEPEEAAAMLKLRLDAITTD
jgi:lysophospholipid acyltransferase (LPLAT)-like uncharacterized protein